MNDFMRHDELAADVASKLNEIPGVDATVTAKNGGRRHRIAIRATMRGRKMTWAASTAIDDVAGLVTFHSGIGDIQMGAEELVEDVRARADAP